MIPRAFTIGPRDQPREVMARAWFALLSMLPEALGHNAGLRVTISLDDEMTDPQRKRLNAMCTDLSKQLRLDFATGGYVHASAAPGGKRLSTDDWRHMMVAVLKGQTSVPHPEGRGFIVLGQSSKSLGKRLTCELIDLIDAFGSVRGVQWTDPTQPQAADYQNTPQYHRNAA